MNSQILNTPTQLINAQRLKISTRIYVPVLRMTTVSIAAKPISLLHLTSTRLKSVSALVLTLSILSSITALAQTVGLLSPYLIPSRMKDQEMQFRLVNTRQQQFSQILTLIR